jgi:hypothetical protein
VLTRLALKLLAHSLNEVTYPAELAGLSFSASNTLTGFQVRPPEERAARSIVEFCVAGSAAD